MIFKWFDSIRVNLSMIHSTELFENWKFIEFCRLVLLVLLRIFRCSWSFEVIKKSEEVGKMEINKHKNESINIAQVNEKQNWEKILNNWNSIANKSLFSLIKFYFHRLFCDCFVLFRIFYFFFLFEKIQKFAFLCYDKRSEKESQRKNK